VFGRFVSATLMKGIVDVSYLPAEAIIKGMIAALFATGAWVLLASILKIPMSISQARRHRVRARNRRGRYRQLGNGVGNIHVVVHPTRVLRGAGGGSLLHI